MANDSKKDRGIFEGADWQNNACLNFSDNSAYGYTEGYRRAAELLVKHVDETGTDQDYLVFPIVFMYRHHFELRLKYIIEMGSLLLDQPVECPP